MTMGKDLQERIALALEESGALPEGLVPVRWRKKDRNSDNDLTLAVTKGLAVIVPVPIPTSALQGTPSVFFDGFECIVQILEMPELNRDGETDLYDLIERISLALHWQPKSAESPLAGILAHPLHLASRPVEMVEGIADMPGFANNGTVVRACTLFFNAALEINAEES